MGLMKDGQPRWPVIAVALFGGIVAAVGQRWHLEILDFAGGAIALLALWELV